MKKTIGGPLTLPDGRIIPLSQAVIAKGFVFTSGQLGVGPGGAVVADSIEDQTRQAIDNLSGVLAAAGATLEDVVKVTGWLVHEGDFAGYNTVYAERFSSMPPARTTVVSQLLVPGARIELEAIAALPS